MSDEIEMMAIAICWAGFVSPEKRDDTPEEYWSRITEKARDHYRAVAIAARVAQTTYAHRNMES